ncbi:MAG: ribbon-helix-helix protein, CopG family [Methyloglobulus sp.]
MARPKKSPDKLKVNRAYVYLDDSLYERLQAESARRGGGSVSDILRAFANEKLPAPSFAPSVPKSDTS